LRRVSCSSGKLSAEKEVAKLKADFSSLQQKIDENQKLINENNIRIAESEKKLSSLSAENRKLQGTRKELEALNKVKADLEQESSRLKSDYDKLAAQNKDLQNSLAASEKKYLALLQENELRISSDNFLITATRGKKAEKIVVRASRAKKLNMAFEVPQNLTQSIGFKLTTPSGTTINPDDKSLTWTFPQDSRNFTASLSTITGEFEQSRQVVLNYLPKGKLAKGEYKIQIYSGDKNIGNCRIVLK
jgi:myosin heavy subunit